MKTLIASDFHIGNTSDSWTIENLLPSKVEETFKQIDFVIDYAIKNTIQKMIWTGDIYHMNRPTPKYEKMLIQRINRCEKNHIYLDTVNCSGCRTGRCFYRGD